MGGGEWKELTMKNVSIESRSSVTILGTFLYFLVTNFVRKVAQMSHLFVGYLEKHHFLIKTVVTTFWATLNLTSDHTVKISLSLVSLHQNVLQLQNKIGFFGLIVSSLQSSIFCSSRFLLF